MLNGDAQHSVFEGEQARIRPVALFSKTERGGEYHMAILVGDKRGHA
jgi:hypothetical protein